MNVKSTQVLVVGGGLAGLVAAKTAKDQGKEVVLATKSGGISEICQGAFDVLGMVPGKDKKLVVNIEEGIKYLTEVKKSHPYTKSHVLDQAMTTLIDLAKDGGYEVSGDGKTNVFLPNIYGTFTTAAYVPNFLKEGALRWGEMKKRKVLVIGFEGHQEFNSAHAAQSYAYIGKKNHISADAYYSADICLPHFAGRTRVSSAEIAEYVDTKEGREELIETVKANVSPRLDLDLILFAPVLGFYTTDEIMKQLAEETGKKVAEVAGAGSSVVGFRLSRALRRALALHQIPFLYGYEAKAVHNVEDKIKVDFVAGVTDYIHSGQKTSITADKLILATGGFLGGGLNRGHKEVESKLLGLNLGAITEEDVHYDVFNAQGQPYLNMGVEVNEKMEVQGVDLKNVLACGDIVAGFDGIFERSSAGVAALTAYEAALSASR